MKTACRNRAVARCSVPWLRNGLGEDELFPCTVTVLWDAGSEGVTLMIRDDTRHKRAAVWLARPGAEQLAGLLRGKNVL